MALVALLAVVALGCAPSKESMTAGQIGCLQEEITINEEDNSTGWTESSQTWVAQCKGRRFICTKTTSGGWGAMANNTTNPTSSSQVACKEALEAKGPEASPAATATPSATATSAGNETAAPAVSTPSASAPVATPSP